MTESSRPPTPEIQARPNVNQLKRNFSEITALKPKPTYTFFNGDLVLGSRDSTIELRRELEAWLDLYKFSPFGMDHSIQLVPIPGNHELNRGGGHQTLAGAEPLWLFEMAPFLPYSNGPHAGAPLFGKKTLVSDQSRLTYSFDGPRLPGARYDHFVALNTDPASPGNSTANSSTVPLNWLQSDLQNARNQPTTWHIFVLGHKQAYVPNWIGGKSGLDFYTDMRNQMFSYLNAAGAAVYFAAHVHIWHKSAPGTNGHTWQVIAGNAGAPPDSQWKQHGGQYFGFTVVSVMSGGKIMIASYGRNFDSKNIEASSPASKYPTTLRDCFCINETGGPTTQACTSNPGLPVTSNASLGCKS